MMSEMFWLSDEQFSRLKPLPPTDTRGVARVDDRRVISGKWRLCRRTDQDAGYSLINWQCVEQQICRFRSFA